MSTSWRSKRNLFEETFGAFCGAHQGLSVDGLERLCCHCFLTGPQFPAAEVSYIFAQVLQEGQERISLLQFEAVLKLLADRLGTNAESLCRAVELSAGPTLPSQCSSNMASGKALPEASSEAPTALSPRQVSQAKDQASAALCAALLGPGDFSALHSSVEPLAATELES